MKTLNQIIKLIKELETENQNKYTTSEVKTRNNDAILMLNIASEYITKPALLKEMSRNHTGSKKEIILWVLS